MLNVIVVVVCRLSVYVLNLFQLSYEAIVVRSDDKRNTVIRIDLSN